MYGYIVPPKNSLSREDHALFNSFYCGLCMDTGKIMGQFARLTTNYDMTFLSILLHDLLSQDVTFEANACLANPFKKRPMVGKNELLDKIVATNIILAYYKAEDGVIDGEGAKYRMIRRSLKKAFIKSKNALPKVNEIVASKYEQLREFERKGEKSIDRVGDAFASMMSEIAAFMLGDKASDDSLKLVYNIGKFVYLVDALDDIDEDCRAKRYNPFLAILPYEKREKFFEDNKEFIQFILNITVNRAIECFNNLTFTQSYDLLKKIVYEGLRQKVEELTSSKKKLKKPTL